MKGISFSKANVATALGRATRYIPQRLPFVSYLAQYEESFLFMRTSCVHSPCLTVPLTKTYLKKTMSMFSWPPHLNCSNGTTQVGAQTLPHSQLWRLKSPKQKIKRSQGINFKARRSITLPTLNLFYHLLNVNYTTNKDSLMVWAAMTLALSTFFVLGK